MAGLKKTMMHTKSCGLFLVNSLRRDSSFRAAHDWMQSNIGSTLCRECKSVNPSHYPNPINAVLTEWPRVTVGGALWWCGIGVFNAVFIDQIKNKRWSCVLGEARNEYDKLITDYVTCYSKNPIVVRGGPRTKYWICRTCGAISTQLNQCKPYVIRSTLDDGRIYLSASGRMYITRDLAERIDWSTWPDACLDPVDILDTPIDGQRLPGDPDWEFWRAEPPERTIENQARDKLSLANSPRLGIPQMTKGHASRLIRQSNLGRFEQELAALLSPSLRLREVALPENDPPIGSSRISGQPDLPESISWPEWGGKPLDFLAQLSLRDITVKEDSIGLPTHGWLWFFYDAENQPWGFDPADTGKWRVLYCTDDRMPLIRRSPTGLYGMPDPGRAVTIHLEWMLPPKLLGLPEIESIAKKADMDFKAKYEALCHELVGPDDVPKHRIRGYPEVIQSDIRLECQLASHGLFCGDDNGFNDPRANSLSSGIDDWVLLLQLDSGSEWTWGDDGRLYFMIRKTELAARNFDNVWVVLQCS